MNLSPLQSAYLDIEGKLHEAIGGLNALARLIGDREDEESVGVAGIMFDQIEKIRTAQAALSKAQQQERRSVA